MLARQRKLTGFFLGALPRASGVCVHQPDADWKGCASDAGGRLARQAHNTLEQLAVPFPAN